MLEGETEWIGVGERSSTLAACGTTLLCVLACVCSTVRWMMMQPVKVYVTSIGKSNRTELLAGQYLAMGLGEAGGIVRQDFMQSKTEAVPLL